MKSNAPGDEAEVAAERGLDIGIDAAGNRDAAAGERETGHHQSHRQRADDERERRRGAHQHRD